MNGLTVIGSVVLTEDDLDAGFGEVQPTTAMANGTYTAINARIVDRGGNASVVGASLTPALVIDAAAPTAPAALDLATADDSGTSTTDNITLVNTGLSLSGTVAESNLRVEVFVDGVSSGNATVTGTTWA